MCVLLLLFLLSSPLGVHCDDQTKNICQEFVKWDVENNEKIIEVTSEYNDAYLDTIVSPESNKEKYKEKEKKYDDYWEKSRSEADKYLERRDDLVNCGNETIFKVLDYYKTKPQNPLSNEDIELLNSQIHKVRAFFKKDVVIDGTTYSPAGLAQYMKQRDYEKLSNFWKQCHDMVSDELTQPFNIMTELKNKKSEKKGYKDLAEEWLIEDYDDKSMEDNMDQLLRDMFPLFTRVHAFVRHKMFNFYKKKFSGGSEEIPEVLSDPKNPIPAHILGDLLGQAWIGIGDIVTPFPEVEVINITDILSRKNFNATKLMELAESFFISMGLEKMTDTFWKKSHFEKIGAMNCDPRAYDLKKKGDYRIFMCTQMNDLDFYNAHHEMGHIVNFMLHSDQPFMYKNLPSPSFPEAIGDTIVLSARSKKHLQAIGFLEKSTEENEDIIKKQRINDLMQKALFQVVFLPYAYIIDKWRFAVFRGEITADKYNKKWWEIRKKFSGVSPPIERPDNGFDIGSKYHVPNFISYSRYFYSIVGQFEFHEALCKAAGQTTDFDNCDISNSKEAGNKLREFLSPGSSEPWRVSLKRLTGFDSFRSKPIVNYFKILDDWLIKHLDENNIPIGWEGMWDMS